jgi:hypothetical protein
METTMDDSYDTDILAWSEQQASVLRGLRSRGDLPNELDLEHVAEEIEDVGRSELNAAQSLIRQMPPRHRGHCRSGVRFFPRCREGDRERPIVTPSATRARR